MGKDQTGIWLWTVECRYSECQERIPFGDPITEPSEPQVLPEKFRIVCPRCGRADDWTPEEASLALAKP